MATIIVATLRDGALPRWSAWVGIPVAAINVVGPFAVQAGTGPFSPQGWYAPVVGLTFAVWLLAVSIAAGWPRRTAGHGRLTARPRTGSPGTALGGAVAGSQLTMPKLDSAAMLGSG